MEENRRIFEYPVREWVSIFLRSCAEKLKEIKKGVFEDLNNYK